MLTLWWIQRDIKQSSFLSTVLYLSFFRISFPFYWPIPCLRVCPTKSFVTSQVGWHKPAIPTTREEEIDGIMI
jgi:hypothetical protein